MAPYKYCNYYYSYYYSYYYVQQIVLKSECTMQQSISQHNEAFRFEVHGFVCDLAEQSRLGFEGRVRNAGLGLRELTYYVRLRCAEGLVVPKDVNTSQCAM